MESRISNLFNDVNWVRSVGGDTLVLNFEPTDKEVLLLRDNGVIVKKDDRGRFIAEFY